MTTTNRRRRLAGVIAVAAPIAVIALGVAAWNDAGEETVRDMTVSVALPDAAKSGAGR